MIERAFFLLVGWLFILAAQAGDYSLTAPERAHSRQRIEVTWAAPRENGALLEIRNEEQPSRRVSYAYVRGNPQAIEAPEKPGSYQVVFIQDREVKASRTLTVFLPDASLQAPAGVSAGESFEVAWAGPNSRQDNITFAERNGAMIRGTSYAYVGNAKDGKVKLRAPADAGNYDIIYRSGSTILARSPIRVGAISATLRAPEHVHAGGQVKVVWEGPRNNQDLITFAERGGGRIRGASYAYVANYDDNAVTINAREQVGPVDIVYVSGGRIIGRSAIDIVEANMALDAPQEVTAMERFQVNWQGMANSGDQVRLLGANREQLAYTYVNPREPNVSLSAPAVEGQANLVYVSRQGRELARRPITIDPAPKTPGKLTVVEAQSGLGPADAVSVIFDASGSMLQRLNGERRVEIARQTLADLVSTTLSERVGFALRVFGHKEAGACRTDLEIPLAPLNRKEAHSVISGIDAKNLARTPLARSIELSAADLADVRGQRILVLLTDGEETCDGDPAAAIESLRSKGWDIQINIVGFAIDDKPLQETFSAWAALGGGSYFNASDREQLSAALVEAVVTRFSVVDGQGIVVGSGRSGDTLTLPAGEYRIQWSGGEQEVTVPSAGAVTATLQ